MIKQDDVIKKINKKTIKKINTIIDECNDSFYDDDLQDLINKYKENMEDYE